METVLQKKDGADVHEHLKEHKVLKPPRLRLPGAEVPVRSFLNAERNKTVRNLLEQHYTNWCRVGSSKEEI